jgi:cardiolipin synthase (CMP-forming)
METMAVGLINTLRSPAGEGFKHPCRHPDGAPVDGPVGGPEICGPEICGPWAEPMAGICPETKSPNQTPAQPADKLGIGSSVTQPSSQPSSQSPSQPSTQLPQGVGDFKDRSSQTPVQPSSQSPSQPSTQPPQGVGDFKDRSSQTPAQPADGPGMGPSSSQPPTQSPSQAPAQPADEPSTQPPVQPSSQSPSQPSTQPPQGAGDFKDRSSQAPAQPADGPGMGPSSSQPPTQSPSQAPAQPSTQSSSQAPAQPSTQSSTQSSTQAPVQPPQGAGDFKDRRLAAGGQGMETTAVGFANTFRSPAGEDFKHPCRHPDGAPDFPPVVGPGAVVSDVPPTKAAPRKLWLNAAGWSSGLCRVPFSKVVLWAERALRFLPVPSSALLPSLLSSFLPNRALGWRAWVPLLLTGGRLLCGPWAAWQIMSAGVGIGPLLWVGAGLLTDALDGFLARRWQVQTPLGAALDPLADKVLIGLVTLALAAVGSLPWGLVLVVILRDFGLIAGALWLRAQGRLVPGASWLGKVNTGVQGAVLVAALAGIQAPWLWALMAITTLISGGQYAYRGWTSRHRVA